MTEVSPSLLAALAATFLVAGLVKGVTGMGLPTVAMAILGALLSPLIAASLLIVPSLVTNLWQMLAGPSLLALLRRLWSLHLAIVVGTLAGSWFLARSDAAGAVPVLGVTLLVYALYGLLAPPLRVPSRAELWLAPVIGLATGILTGATGVFVIPAVPYLQALGLEKDDLVQALGASFTVSTLALFAGLALHGAWAAVDAGLSVLAVFPALLGMGLGQILRRHISPPGFRRGFLVALALLGAEMALRGVIR